MMQPHSVRPIPVFVLPKWEKREPFSYPKRTPANHAKAAAKAIPVVTLGVGQVICFTCPGLIFAAEERRTAGRSSNSISRSK